MIYIDISICMYGVNEIIHWQGFFLRGTYILQALTKSGTLPINTFDPLKVAIACTRNEASTLRQCMARDPVPSRMTLNRSQIKCSVFQVSKHVYFCLEVASILRPWYELCCVHACGASPSLFISPWLNLEVLVIEESLECVYYQPHIHLNSFFTELSSHFHFCKVLLTGCDDKL